MTILKSGKYFIGDPCYVLNHVWEQMCDQMIAGGTCLEGAFVTPSGHRVAVYNTYGGDGVFPDQLGNSFPVDAGCIGAVPIEAIDPKVLAECGEPVEGSYNNDLGIIYDFDSSFECKSDIGSRMRWDGNGTLVFGHIRIDTNPIEDEEEEAA